MSVLNLGLPESGAWFKLGYEPTSAVAARERMILDVPVLRRVGARTYAFADLHAHDAAR